MVVSDIRVAFSMVFVDTSFASPTPEYTITEYFAKSCPHCVKMQPVWKEAVHQAGSHPSIANVQWVQKECYGDNWAPGPDLKFCQTKGIDAFPTIQLEKNGSNQMWEAPPLTGATAAQKAEQLLKFVEAKTGATVKMNSIGSEALVAACAGPLQTGNFWNFL